MFERIHRNSIEILARLLQMQPNQQLVWILGALFIIILLNEVSNVLFEWLNLTPWWTLALLPIIILVLLTIRSVREIRRPHRVAVHTGNRPAPHAGLIWMLSPFNSRGDQQAKGFAEKEWRLKELQEALDQPTINWPLIIERFTHSNMRPVLEAIRYHSQDDVLQHIWLVTTSDLSTQDESVVQKGSCHLAPLLATILKEGFGIRAKVHSTDPELEVPPYDADAAYRAVEHIYTTAVPRVGLRPDQVIADLTGGRVPMTGGMILACATRDWAMQYTTTDRDPAKKGPGDVPLPLIIQVNAWEVRRRAIEAFLEGEEPQRA